MRSFKCLRVILCCVLSLAMCLANTTYAFATSLEGEVIFEDDFTSFDESRYANADNVTTVALDNAIQIENAGKLRVACEAPNKEVTFDFKYDKNYGSMGGIFVKMHYEGEDIQAALSTSTYYFALMPQHSDQKMKVDFWSHGGVLASTNAKTMSAETWYTCKGRLEDGTISAKVWERGTEEPAEWDVTAHSDEYKVTGKGVFSLEIDTNGTSTKTTIDNFKITDLSGGVKFEDDFTSFDTSNYFAAPSVTAVALDNAIQIVNGGKLQVACDYVNKEIAFDFKYDQNYGQNGGIFTKMHIGSDYRTSTYYFALMPQSTSAHMKVDYWNYGGQLDKTFPKTMSKDIWYSCKARLEDGTISAKVWERGTEEPATWDVSAYSDKYTETGAGTFSIELDTNGTATKTTIDNLKISKLAESPKVEIALSVDDSTKGTVSGAGSYKTGKPVTVTAAANVGYKFVNWTENGAVISTDKQYTFTVEAARNLVANFAPLEDPQYTYFFDDYESYQTGEVVRDNMAIEYISFDEGKYSIVDVAGKGNVLQGMAPSNFSVDCSIIEKEVSFDFLYEGAMKSYSGIYVKLLLKKAGVDEQYFSINPGFGDSNVIVTDTTNSVNTQKSEKKDFEEKTWYSVKSRMIDQRIWVKVWPSAETEPADWTCICDMSEPVTDNENAYLLMSFARHDTTDPLKIQIDNFSIKTWDELAAKPEYTVTVNANEASMGSVSGGGKYMEGNPVTIKAEANPGHKFVNWTDGNNEIVSTKNTYSFRVSKDETYTANFKEVIPTVKSFMADGMTLPALINTATKTVNVVFASDVDLTQVRPYFYFDEAKGTEAKPYEVMDLSDGIEDIGSGWIVKAKQNRVMLNLYVDGTNGSDDNTGRTPKEAFATIAKAQEAVRALETWTGDVLVNIADGKYVLTETLSFDSSDSAENGCSVIYRSLSGNADNVIISSGIELKGWEKSDVANGAAWVIDASEIPYSRELYAEGELATLARSSAAQSIEDPHKDLVDEPELELDSTYGYKASGSKADLYKWKNKSDIEFVYEVRWTYSVIPVADITDNGDGTSKVIMNAEAFQVGLHKIGQTIIDPNYIQNAFELLDEKGEWYFDRADKKIYYIPLDGEDPDNKEMVIPALDQLIAVNGTGGNTVNGLAFKDITFEYTSYSRVHEKGHLEIQSNLLQDPDMVKSNPHDCFVRVPGGITANYASCMRLEGCTFQKFAATGVDLGIGVTGSTLVANEFKEIGGTGVQIGGVSVRDAQPFSEVTYEKGVLNMNAGAAPERVTEQNLVMSNKLSKIGVAYQGSSGIFIGYARDITIAHNEISEMSYTGISAGWGWGYWDKGGRPDMTQKYPSMKDYYVFDTPAIQERFVIENNKIWNIMQRLQDGGAIYTLSNMPGSIIRGNYMYDVPHEFGSIYFDEATRGIVDVSRNITHNVFRSVNDHTMYDEYSRELGEVIHDNFFTTGDPTAVNDPLYQEIVANAGLLTMAADRTFDVSTASSITGGSVSVVSANTRTADIKARAGEIITITATPNSGYVLDKITTKLENTILYEDGDVVKMIMPDEAETVGAVFTQKNDTNTGGGSNSGSGSSGSSNTGSGSGSSGNSDKTESSKPVEVIMAPGKTPAQANSSTGNVKTGDSANVLPYVICMLAAGIAISIVYTRRKREQK